MSWAKSILILVDGEVANRKFNRTIIIIKKKQKGQFGYSILNDVLRVQEVNYFVSVMLCRVSISFCIKRVK